jgi:hypothetical protein
MRVSIPPPADTFVSIDWLLLGVICMSTRKPHAACTLHKKASVFGAHIAVVSSRLSLTEKLFVARLGQPDTMHLDIFSPHVFKLIN